MWRDVAHSFHDLIVVVVLKFQDLCVDLHLPGDMAPTMLPVIVQSCVPSTGQKHVNLFKLLMILVLSAVVYT